MNAASNTSGQHVALVRVAAVLLLVLLAVFLALRFWAGDRAYRFAGPTHIAAGPEGVFVHAARDILRLSTAGVLLEIVAIERTGLSADPIDLRLQSGGLLLAGQRPAVLRSCRLDSWECRPLLEGLPGDVRRQFKILPGQNADDWLLSDAADDALWRLDIANATMREVLPAGTLAGPNGLARSADGNPWIADTDHRRIVELVAAPDGTFVTGREHSAVNDLTIGQRHYPMMIEWGPGDQWWVIQATDFSQARADLVVYDPERGAQAVVTLPVGAYPTDLAVLGTDVLVTDMERYVVYRVDGATRRAEPFGDAAFRRQLEAYQEKRARYASLSTAALVALIAVAVLLIFAAIRLTPRSGRWSHPPPAFDSAVVADRAPMQPGSHWLRPNPRMRWFTRNFERVFYGLFGLFCLGAAALYGWSCRPIAESAEGTSSAAGELGPLLLVAGLAIGAFVPMVHRSARVLRRRLGVEGSRLRVELEDGRRLLIEPAEVVWNGRALAWRQYTFPLRGGRQLSLYAPGEIETWLAPLLRDARQVNEWQLLRHQWVHRDPVLRATIAAIVVLSLVAMATEWLVG